MGYEVDFVPTEEKMNEYKPWDEKGYSEEKEDERINEIKREIVAYCMMCNPENTMVYTAENKIRMLLKLLTSTIRDAEKHRAYFRWKEDEEHTIWYCGWEFSKESSLTEARLVESTVDSLFTLTYFVKTPDYFTERDNFYEKLEALKEDVDGFIDCMGDIVIHEIIDDLQEFKSHDDNDDLKEMGKKYSGGMMFDSSLKPKETISGMMCDSSLKKEEEDDK